MSALRSGSTPSADTIAARRRARPSPVVPVGSVNPATGSTAGRLAAQPLGHRAVERQRHQRLERLLGLLERAGLLQVNVSSLLGNHGLDAQEIAVDLVRHGRAYCLASDGHPGTREHTQQLGFHLLIRAGASSVQAYRLTQSNPRFLLLQGLSAGFELDVLQVR